MVQPAGFQTTMVGGYDGAALQALAVDAGGRPKVVLTDPGGSPQAQVTSKAADGSGPNNGVVVWPFSLIYSGAGWDRLRTPAVFKPISGLALTAGVGATVWTPGAGKKIRLMGGWFSSSAAAALILADNAVASVIFPTPVLGAAGAFTLPPMGNGVLLALANNVLKLDCTAGTTVTGCVFGTEE